MFRPPYLARVAAGAAVVALEEARKLPATALHLPITAASHAFQTTMHVQQFVASLAVKGDEALRGLYGQPEEQPEWATFDEDEDIASGPGASNGAAPEIVEYLDYPALTLAQLRARLRSLSTDELGELLSYEQRTHDRAPFVTMLTNRIATAKAQ